MFQTFLITFGYSFKKHILQRLLNQNIFSPLKLSTKNVNMTPICIMYLFTNRNYYKHFICQFLSKNECYIDLFNQNNLSKKVHGLNDLILILTFTMYLNESKSLDTYLKL